MGKKILSIILSLALLAGVGWVVKEIFFDFAQKEKKSRDLGSAHKEAYRLAGKANQLRYSGDFYQAGQNYVKAAERLRTCLKYNKKDPKAPAIHKKMILYYEQGIELFTKDALRQPVDQTSLVDYIYDGDTIKLANKEDVRYLGIDTPEIAHKKHETDEPFGQAANRANSRMVKGRTVQLRFDGNKKGKYGRTLAYVFNGGRFINAELIKLGLAKYYHPEVKPLRYTLLFLACEAMAKEKKVGIWAKKML